MVVRPPGPAAQERVAAQGFLGAKASGQPVGESLRGRHEDGLPVADHEPLTPVCSARSCLARRHRGQPVMMFGTEVTRERLAATGVPVAAGEEAAVVFVAHVDAVDLPARER